MIPTGWQIREGRKLIAMSQADLAEAAGVGPAVVVRAELVAHMPMLTRRDSAAIQQVLEMAGVKFVQGDGGIGAQLRKVDQGSEASSIRAPSRFRSGPPVRCQAPCPEGWFHMQTLREGTRRPKRRQARLEGAKSLPFFFSLFDNGAQT